MKKQRISVIDRDAIRSQAIAQQLAADSTADVIVSGPDGASGAYDDIDAYIVGATGQGHWTASVLDRIKSETPHARVVVVGINGRFERKTLDTETLIVRSAGASADPDTVSSMVKGLLEDQPLPAESPARRPAHLFRSLVGDSQPIRHIQDLIDHVATTPSTVLITGESGTGKEVVARNIHYRSSRRDHPFVPVNCAAIPPELFESELFGHEKGAFTGALSARKGRFELADKGTLFLDEIGDMPLGTQTKLLRVIQERLFERLGSNKSMSTDVRIIAATHCDLEKRIGDKRFRRDLYYRLNVFPIHMPSLGERTSDIPLLVNELRARLRNELGLAIAFTEDAMHCLQHRHWEGNVRELANVIERLAVLYPGETISREQLPADLVPADGELPETSGNEDRAQLPQDGVDLKQRLFEVEKDLIEEALQRSDGVIARAARLLRIGRTTLTEKMRRHQVNTDQSQPLDDDGDNDDGT